MQHLKTLVEELCPEERAVEITRRILSIPSPQTELFEAEPLVKKFIAETILPFLETLEIPCRLDERGNLIASMGSPGGRTILLVGYAMTPQEGSMAEGYIGKIVSGEKYGYLGDCIRGRGACEQKGALGAMLSALTAIARFKYKLNGQVVFICSTAGETGRHDSLEFILDNSAIKADLALIGLGTNNEICLGNKGRVDVLIEVQGRSCHSSTPHQGVNALEGAAEVILALRRFVTSVEHPFLGRSTLAPMYIESYPRAAHTIQDRCIISYDRRLVPGEIPEDALEQIKELLREITGYPLRVSRGSYMYPSEVSRDSIISSLTAEAVRTVVGQEPAYVYLNSSLDAGLLNRCRIETLMFGPGEVKYAHTAEEIVRVKQVVDASRIYALTILSYLGI